MGPIVLNVAADGSISFAGSAWLFAAFLPTQKLKLSGVFTFKPMPYQFTVDTGTGVSVGQPGDYLVTDPNGKLFVVKAADLGQYTAA